MKTKLFGKTIAVVLLSISCSVSLANTTIGNPIDIGSLTTLSSYKDTGENYYRFSLPVSTPVSVFLNGLSAGYQIQLLDANGNILQTSSNNGTTWTSATNPGTTGGAIVAALNGNVYYYVRVSPTTLSGNPLYKSQDGSYTVNMIPDNAPNTVTVAAKNSVPVGVTTYKASGVNDQNIINQAIAAVGNAGGGTVLLRPGTYFIHDNVVITYNNVTLTGSGWSTELKIANGKTLEDAGLLRSAYHTSSENKIITHFSNQHFLHMSLNGNKGGSTGSKDSYGNFGTYRDSSFEDLRVHDFHKYGFDPHQNQHAVVNTYRLTIKDSLSDHNGMDGMTTDGCSDSNFINNILDANTRHGINIITGSTNNLYANNISTNNGSNGITIQPGGDSGIAANNHILRENIVQKNKGSGIYIYLAEGIQAINNTITHNTKYGIQVRFSSSNVVRGNTITDNSFNTSSIYDGIAVQSGSSTNQLSNNNSITENSIQRNKGSGIYVYLAQGNQLLDNTISQNGKYGIQLKASFYNTINENTVSDNSQSALGAYSGIYLSSASGIYSTHNQILQNFVSASTPTTYNFGIAESSTGDDYNSVSLNTIQGVNIPIRLKGPHSTATSNTILP